MSYNPYKIRKNGVKILHILNINTKKTDKTIKKWSKMTIFQRVRWEHLIPIKNINLTIRKLRIVEKLKSETKDNNM